MHDILSASAVLQGLNIWHVKNGDSQFCEPIIFLYYLIGMTILWNATVLFSLNLQRSSDGQLKIQWSFKPKWPQVTASIFIVVEINCLQSFMEGNNMY